MIETALHDSDGARRQNRAFVVKPTHQDVDAVPLAAKNILRGNLTVLENELARVGAAHAELVELLGRTKSLERLLDDKRRDAARARARIGLGVDNKRIG